MKFFYLKKTFLIASAIDSNNKLANKPNELEPSYLNSHTSPILAELASYPQNSSASSFGSHSNKSAKKSKNQRSAKKVGNISFEDIELQTKQINSNTNTYKIPSGWCRTITTEFNAQLVIYTNPIGDSFYSIGEIRSYLLAENTCKCGLECPLNVNETFNFDPNLIINPSDSSLVDTSNNHVQKANKQNKMCCLHKTRLSSGSSSENIFSSTSVKNSKRIKLRHSSNSPGNCESKASQQSSNNLSLKNTELIRSLDDQHFNSSIDLEHSKGGLLENLDLSDNLEFIQDKNLSESGTLNLTSFTENIDFRSNNNNTDGFNEFDDLLVSNHQNYRIDMNKHHLNVSVVFFTYYLAHVYSV